jgi:hypothetical protein
MIAHSRSARSPLPLETPPVPRIVPAGVFDAFGWCASDTLEWRRPLETGTLDLHAPVTSANPPGMVFFLRHSDAAPFLPRELAGLHVPGLAAEGEWALAPWAIDDATDLLYAHRARPALHLGLATASLAGLFWGLHDWAHFHNHGPFEERAWTELQCDVTALAWLWKNRGAIGIGEEDWARVRDAALGVGRERFAAEGREMEEALLDADRVRALVG